MAIDVGSHLGAYEILALLGEGGMGRVYRARDTRLKRDVAIKALPLEVACDDDRVARFRREAEALAALNHPHIAGIYDLLDADGSQFLVLELVEGETIADRIGHGPIPIDEAVAIARQIAEALEAAHGRGIVHRDLKPANIQLTANRQVKVLDFGLAKVFGPSDGPGFNVAHSPTFTTPAMTIRGVILGTAAYMSPEQARGQQVDAQADVWALGCVLYEMLTGRPPFTGPTVTDVLAAVVRGDPDWSALPPATPAGLRAVLRRCLQKDPSRRLHHIADVRIELEEAHADPLGPVETATKRPKGVRWVWATAAGLGLVAVAFAIALMQARQPGPVAPEMRVEINTPPSPDPLFVAFSPDGQKLVFVAAADGSSRLWLRSLDSATARPLPGTELATSPFWSPDSRSLGFFADGRLKRIDIAGGLTQTLASAPIGSGGSWSAKDVIVYAPSAIGGLSRVPAAGGEAVALTHVQMPGQTGHRLPVFLPDANHFLFYARGIPELRGIFVGALDGSEPRRLLDAESGGVLALPNHLLFARQGTLFAQRFDPADQRLSGEPFAVADRIAFDGGVNTAAVAASAEGSLAYRTGGARGQRQLTWFDRSGRKTGTVGDADVMSLLNPEISPDGHWVAINRTVDAYQDIWQIETARGVLRRFTFDPGSDQIPVWSPDGQRIIFGSNRKGAYDLYEKPASGPGTERLLSESPQNKFPLGFSPDGRFLLYRNTGENTDWDLWALPLQGERKPFPVVQTSFQEMMAELSPDGQWIAYQTNESGRYEIYVQSFPEAGARTQISTNGGAQPRWRRDGKELFYIALDGQLVAAPISVDAKGHVQTASPLSLFVIRTPGGPVPSPQKQRSAVAPDGRSFLVNSLTDEAIASPITLVLNWKPAGR